MTNRPRSRDSVTADNYVRVVAEVMRRDGIELNGVDMRNIRTRVLDLLAYRRRSQTTEGEREKYLPVEEAGTIAAVTC